VSTLSGNPPRFVEPVDKEHAADHQGRESATGLLNKPPGLEPRLIKPIIRRAAKIEDPGGCSGEAPNSQSLESNFGGRGDARDLLSGVDHERPTRE
jgi:hypothetical protein